MFYREDERNLMKEHQIHFAEKAHEFMCCDVPTIHRCIECDIVGADVKCLNKAELKRYDKEKQASGRE